MHGDENRRVHVFFGDKAKGVVANREVIGEIDLFEGGIFADQLYGKGAGLARARDLRLGVAGDGGSEVS